MNYVIMVKFANGITIKGCSATTKEELQKRIDNYFSLYPDMKTQVNFEIVEEREVI